MKYLLSILILFLFGGCSIKNYKHTKTKLLVIKSPKLKFADVGFIRNDANAVELELFSAGIEVQKITINHLVCVRDGCMSKSGFNKDYLNKSYPDDILQNIILAKPIFNNKNLLKNKDGFEQYIKNKDVDISYKVTKKSIYFKDKKNKILFKIKDTYHEL